MSLNFSRGEIYYVWLGMKGKVFLLILIIVIGIYSLFSWWRNNTSSYSQTMAPFSTVRIGNIGEFSIFDLIAQKEGFFEQNGIHADITTYQSGPPAVTDLLAGRLDIAVAADFVGVRTIFTNPHLRILSQASRHKVWYMVARVDKGISAISDLRGKRIGVTRKSAGEFYLSQFLNFNHMSSSDITIVDLSTSDITKSLQNGDIDAGVTFNPYAFQLKNEFAKNGIEWSIQGVRQTFALVYSTDTFISSHPEVIERYISSLLEAESFFNQDPQRAKEFLVDQLHYDKQYVDAMWSNFTFTQRLDQELLLTMEDQARFVIANNLSLTKTIPDYLDYIYFDGLQKLDPDRVTIIH